MYLLLDLSTRYTSFHIIRTPVYCVEIFFLIHVLLFLICRALFTRWSNLDQGVYNINGVSPEIMDLIIHYMYTQDIQVTTDEVKTLLATANYLLIQDLVMSCCEFIQEHLNPDNCLRIWQYADTHSCYELRDQAYMYTLHHFEDVVFSQSGKFLNLTMEQLSDILEKDELNIKEEKTAFQAVIPWIRYDPSVRTQHIVNLLPKVRLALVTQEYFLENIKKNPVVSSVCECQPIITRAMKAMYDSNTRHSHLFTRPRLPYSILFAIGFSVESSKNILETYDSRLDSWMCISSREEQVRVYHGTVFLDGLVYVIGGSNIVKYFNTMCTFDPLDGTWNEAAPMHSRRGYVSVTVLDGFIYAMGGFNGTVSLNTAERYQPSTNQWSLIPSMLEQRSDASAATLNGKTEAEMAALLARQKMLHQKHALQKEEEDLRRKKEQMELVTQIAVSMAKMKVYNDLRSKSIDTGVELLIGANVPEALEPWQIIHSQNNSPYAIKTMFGWTVNGPMNLLEKHAVEEYPHTTVNKITVMKLDELWERQFKTDFPECVQEEQQGLTKEDHRFMDFVSRSTRLMNEHYYIGLPLKNETLVMPRNRAIVE
ncbi:kelch-like protein 10 isoform X1 [Tachysurus ichikawai]